MIDCCDVTGATVRPEYPLAHHAWVERTTRAPRLHERASVCLISS
jgi:hypothetical protein